MKKTFKKIFAIALSALMCISLAACDSNTTKGTSTDNKIDISSSELSTYLGRTEKETFDYLDIDDSKIANREKVSETQSDIKLKDKFKYGGVDADVTLTVIDDHLLFISYRFGDTEKNGEEYQKAAFDFAKAIEAKFAKEYEEVEYYNGDLNELTEETFKANEEDSKSWNRNYVIEDEFGLIEKFNESPLVSDVKYDELQINVTLNKFNLDSAKAAEVNIGLRGATKTEAK